MKSSLQVLCALICLFAIQQFAAAGECIKHEAIKYGSLDQQNLDLYVPQGQKNFPVIVCVHGGAWIAGDKKDWDFFGRCMAQKGIGVAAVNYRTSAFEKFSVRPQDTARSIAWVYNNIHRYGGDPKHLFLFGYSAGGHLVSLMAADESYLRRHGLPRTIIRGVISVSGVYQVDRMPGVDLLASKAEQKHASPQYRAQNCRIPFQLFYAEKDAFHLDRQAALFHRTLQKQGCDSQIHMVKGKNHFTVIDADMLRRDYGSEMVGFIRSK